MFDVSGMAQRARAASRQLAVASASARNAALPPDTFDISAEQLEEWWGLFEVPTADELT